MNKLTKAKKAYEDIFKVIKKYEDIICFNIKGLEKMAKLHLFGIELKEKYKLNIDPTKISSLEWNKLKEHIDIALYGEKYRRLISLSDNGKQPENELLLRISFPTGPFIFSKFSPEYTDYPVEFFNKFFEELKTYNPKYTDNANRSLYFSMDNAYVIFNEFDKILEKYKKLNENDINRRKIEKIEKELSELKKGR